MSDPRDCITDFSEHEIRTTLEQVSIVPMVHWTDSEGAPVADLGHLAAFGVRVDLPRAGEEGPAVLRLAHALLESANHGQLVIVRDHFSGSPDRPARIVGRAARLALDLCLNPF